MYPTLSLGPLALPTAGLTYILGIWLVLSLIERAAQFLDLNADDTYGAAVAALAAGFIGARLIFVALHWSAYNDNLVGIVWPLTSGFNLWGGLVIGLAAGFFYGRAKRLPPWSTLDALAPGLVAGLMVISLADFLAGPGYGVTSDLPWAINLYEIRRHPVQLYELLFGALALGVWWRGRHGAAFPGHLFLQIAAVYSAGRLFSDAFRANAWLTGGGYHLLQIISLAVLLLAVFLLARGSTAPDDGPEVEPAAGQREQV